MKEGTKVRFFLSISLGIHLFLFVIAYTLFPEFKIDFVNVYYPQDIDILILPAIEVSPKEKIILKEVLKTEKSTRNPIPIENEEIKESEQDKPKEDEDKIENELKDRPESLQKTETLIMEEKREEAIKAKEIKEDKKEIIKEDILTSHRSEEESAKPPEIDQKIHDEKPFVKESVKIALNVTQVLKEDTQAKKDELPQFEPPKSEEVLKFSDSPKITNSKGSEKEIKSSNAKDTDQESLKPKESSKPEINPLSIKNNENDLNKFEKTEVQKTSENISFNNKSTDKAKLNSKIDSVLIQPRYVNNPKPQYPSEARRRGYEGEVLLRVKVLANGHVGQIELKNSSGHKILDQSAIEAVKQWRFIPAMRDGEAIDLWVNIPIKFQLK